MAQLRQRGKSDAGCSLALKAVAAEKLMSPAHLASKLTNTVQTRVSKAEHTQTRACADKRPPCLFASWTAIILGHVLCMRGGGGARSD